MFNCMQFLWISLDFTIFFPPLLFSFFFYKPIRAQDSTIYKFLKYFYFASAFGPSRLTKDKFYRWFTRFR